MKPTVLLSLAGLVLGLALQAQAETRYVTDQLVLSMRSTPTQTGEIVAHPRTDDLLEVLEEEGNYARVRDAQGREGYVLKQYLSKNTPKPERIAQLEAELARLKEQHDARQAGRQDQAETLQQLQAANNALETALAESRTELARVQNDYTQLRDGSQNLVDIINERDQLMQSNQALEAETEVLREENKSLLVSAMVKWFMAGAGVLFFGWMIGKASRKRPRAF